MLHNKEVIRKQIERYGVITVLKNLIINESCLEDSERPDFILNLPDKKIGIEVTRIVSIQQEQVRNALNGAYIKIKDFLDKYPQKGHCVSCHLQDYLYNEGCKIRINDIEEGIVSEIMGMWNHSLEEENCKFIWIYDDFYVPGYDQNDFSINEVYWCSDDIQDAIDKSIISKRKKLKNYRIQPCNSDIEEYWLVINIPSSTSYWFRPEKIYTTPTNEYAKIFLTKDSEFKILK